MHSRDGTRHMLVVCIDRPGEWSIIDDKEGSLLIKDAGTTGTVSEIKIQIIVSPIPKLAYSVGWLNS